MMFKNKNVLVTGGTGMIGRELVQLLLDRGAKIRVASLDEPVDFFEEVEFHKVDLTIYENCEMICEGMDYVFHVAGIKASAEMPKIKPLNYFIPLVKFNINMMEAAFRANVAWYLYTSSVGVYSPAEIKNENEVIIDGQFIGRLKGMKLDLDLKSGSLKTDIKSLRKAARLAIAPELTKRAKKNNK